MTITNVNQAFVVSPSNAGIPLLAETEATHFVMDMAPPNNPEPPAFHGTHRIVQGYREEIIAPGPGGQPTRQWVQIPLVHGGVYREEIGPPAVPGGLPTRRLIPISTNPNHTYRTEVLPPTEPSGPPIRVRILVPQPVRPPRFA